VIGCPQPCSGSFGLAVHVEWVRHKQQVVPHKAAACPHASEKRQCGWFVNHSHLACPLFMAFTALTFDTVRYNQPILSQRVGGRQAVARPRGAAAGRARHPQTGAPWRGDALAPGRGLLEPGAELQCAQHLDPLQPATLANGCMQFVPGSHKHEVLPHHSINDDPRIHGQEVDTTSTNDAVACPLPAGGATVHTNRTLHYAGPNQTDEPRRAYILLFGVPPVPRSEPPDFYWNTIKATAPATGRSDSQAVLLSDCGIVSR